MTKIILFLVTLLSIFTLSSTQGYNTATPMYITSEYVRAGSQYVIQDLTQQSASASYTFIFSSPFSGIPSLAYGIKQYRGTFLHDFRYFQILFFSGASNMEQQAFKIVKGELTESTFTVYVGVGGTTNLYTLNIAYIAIDPTFPHHLNSFDLFPINYGTSLTNINVNSTSPTSYTNYVNYSQQAADRKYHTFGTPLDGNKIVLFMCVLLLDGSPFDSIDLRVNYTIVNETHYKLVANLSAGNIIQGLYFSQIIFDVNNVQSSKQYTIVFQNWETPVAGGFLPLPWEFNENFIMGVQDFSTTDGNCGFEYQWEFDWFGDQPGVILYESTQMSGVCGFARMTSTVFYIKTWQCPDGYSYFNLTSQLCQDACPMGYYLDYNSSQCSKCQIGCEYCLSQYECAACMIYTGRYIVNTPLGTSCACWPGTCQDPNNLTNPNCVQCSEYCHGCDTPTSCYKCKIGYTVSPIKTCINCGLFCLTCDTNATVCYTCQQNYTVNPITKKCECDSSKGFITNPDLTCKLCGVGCADCLSIYNGCLTCNNTYKLNLTTKTCQCDLALGYVSNPDSTCKFCGIGCSSCLSITDGCLTCQPNYLLNSTIKKCECDSSKGYTTAADQTCVLATSCGTGCANCTSPTAGCLICQATYKLNLTTKACQCDQSLGYVTNPDLTCKLCGIGCSSCVSITDGCLTCQATYSLNISTKKCECDSSKGYITAADQTCVLASCGIGCANCTSPTAGCLVCQNTYKLNLTTKTCECDQSSGYVTNADLTCKLCGIGCSSCISMINGCSTCYGTYLLNPVTKKCQCDSLKGYLTNPDMTCKLCGIGCVDCQSITNGCLTCNNTYKLNLTTKTCQCDLALGYVSNPDSTCKFCGIGCSSCVSITDGCLTCQPNYLLNSTIKKCECDSSKGYTTAADQTCVLATSCGTGCANCTSPTAGCLICQATYKLNLTTKACQCDQSLGYVTNPDLTCKLCGIGCSSCVSITDGCLTCQATYSLNISTKKCECDSSKGYTTAADQTCVLASCGIGCANCTSIADGCLICQAMYKLNLTTKKCQCDQSLGYLTNPDSTCKLCGSNCANCTSINQGCTTCKQGFKLNPQTKKCQCPIGMSLSPQTSLCIKCHGICLTCTGRTEHQCLSCYDNQNRVALPQANGLVNCMCNPYNYVESSDGSLVCVKKSQEACDYGYIYIKKQKKCVEVCGDGKNFGNFQCDDGNSVDGDGCSKTCQIEEGFNCTVSELTSVCMYVGTIDIINAISYKNPYGNHLFIKCELFPVKDFFYKLKWKEGLILVGPNMTVLDAWMEGKWLAINTTYFEDLSGKTLTIKYSSVLANGKAKNATSRRLFSAAFDFDLTLRDYELPIAPANNLKPLYFEETTYQKVQLLQRVCFIIAICTIVLISCSMLLKTTLPIWQMVFCLQTLFLSLGSVKNMNPLLSGLTEFSFIKGFRASVVTVEGYINQDPSMEYNIRVLGYVGSLYDNMNIMFIVQLAFILASGALYLMSRKDIAMSWPFQFMKRELLLMILFNCMNFALSLGLIKSVQPIELTIACVAGFVIIVQIYYFVNNLTFYFHMEQTFNLTRANLKYAITIYLLLRICQALSIALFRSQTLVCSIILLSCQAIISLGFTIFRPYKNKIYNVLNIVCEWAVAAFLTMNLMFNLDKIQQQNIQNTMCLAQICINYFIIFIMVLAFWYSFVMDYLCKRVHGKKVIYEKDDFQTVKVKDSKTGNKVEVASFSQHKMRSEILAEDFVGYDSRDMNMEDSTVIDYAYEKKGRPFF